MVRLVQRPAQRFRRRRLHPRHRAGGPARRLPGHLAAACLAAGCLLPVAPSVAGQEPPGPVRLTGSGPAAAGPAPGGPAAPAGELVSPTRLTVSPQGDHLLVVDYQQRKVLTLDRGSLAVRGEIALEGRPAAVAAWQGWIYVGDEAAGEVGVFNPAGQRLFGFEGTVARPADIAVDPRHRRVFVADTAARDVKVFDPRGSLLYTLGDGGPAQERLIHPTGVAFDPQRREVLVSDFGDPENQVPARVQIYSELGEHRATLSGSAQSRGLRFSRPQGLAADGEGRIYVVDSLLGQVLVFDRDTLTGLRALGSYGSETGQLLLPLDVALDPDTGRLFVTSNRTGRIEILDPGGTP